VAEESEGVMQAIAKGKCDFCGNQFDEPMEYSEGKGWRMKATGFTVRRGAIKDCIELIVEECCAPCYEKVRDAILAVKTA
jgi:hypothetical protein